MGHRRAGVYRLTQPAPLQTPAKPPRPLARHITTPRRTHPSQKRATHHARLATPSQNPPAPLARRTTAHTPRHPQPNPPTRFTPHQLRTPRSASHAPLTPPHHHPQEDYDRLRPLSYPQTDDNYYDYYDDYDH